MAQTWYDGLQMSGNTSINPFFYGTYLGETKPGEPVMRSKNQAFQADAIGAAHQLTPAHFNRTHTFRVEWQPGPGGRIDWFTKGHNINSGLSIEGDGLGKDWVHAYAFRDKSLSDLMGSQIPIEPMSLILNTAVSSTWGFPYDVPEWCTKCYDCDDPKCACTFAPGFCKMLREGDVAMYVDSIRIYQSRDPLAHVGAHHTLGCDPPAYPTREWIRGHEYRYMRNPPFSYEDKHPLRPVQKGGGPCTTDADCGAEVKHVNLTDTYEQSKSESDGPEKDRTGRGMCVNARDMNAMFSGTYMTNVCKCSPGFTGPNCLAQDHRDETISAYETHQRQAVFETVPNLILTPFMMLILVALAVQLVGILLLAVRRKKSSLDEDAAGQGLRRPAFHVTLENKDLIITGRSV
jgi:hypothetical protein